MVLPKNITQIGETNPHCKIYVEDYVISYIKQLNRFARDKELAVALYGVRKEEDGVTYLFLYGAGKLNFLQKECRHLSQAVQQEVEKLRKRYFQEYAFLGYRLLDGEMVEGFHVCEQGVCRYIEGYAQFYEKNDSMLAYMVDERQEEAAPEEFDQGKYDAVKKRQEERRALADEKAGHAFRKGLRADGQPKEEGEMQGEKRLRRMKYSAAAVFAVLCVTGLAVMGNDGRMEEIRSAAGKFLEEITKQQLPDSVEVSNGSVQVGTIVAEDKLNEAILKENDGTGSDVSPVPGTSAEPAGNSASGSDGQAVQQPPEQAAPEPEQAAPEPEQATPEPVQATPEPEQAVPEPVQTVPEVQPVSYTVKRGDTLIGICIEKYGSDARVPEVCSLNDISNPDNIKIGQKILLP